MKDNTVREEFSVRNLPRWQRQILLVLLTLVAYPFVLIVVVMSNLVDKLKDFVINLYRDTYYDLEKESNGFMIAFKQQFGKEKSTLTNCGEKI